MIFICKYHSCLLKIVLLFCNDVACTDNRVIPRSKVNSDAVDRSYIEVVETTPNVTVMCIHCACIILYQTTKCACVNRRTISTMETSREILRPCLTTFLYLINIPYL